MARLKNVVLKELYADFGKVSSDDTLADKYGVSVECIKDHRKKSADGVDPTKTSPTKKVVEKKEVVRIHPDVESQITDMFAEYLRLKGILRKWL